MNYSDKILAVIGVTNNRDKYGYKIFKDLKASNYRVYGISPKIDKFEDGTKIYPSLKELPEKPDIVITVVKPEITSQIVDLCKELGINHIWCQPGSESEEVIEKARNYGIKITLSCFMVRNGIW